MPFDFMLLFITIPAALVVALGLGVRSRATSEDASARWQQFLFLTLVILLLFAMIPFDTWHYLGFVVLPCLIGVLAAFLLSLTDLFYWSNQRRRMTLLYTLGIGMLVIILAVAYLSYAIYLIAPTLIVALTWKTREWHSSWGWIALLILLMLLAAEYDLLPSALSINLPESLRTIVGIAEFFLPVVSIVVASRLIYSVFVGNRTLPLWNIGLRLLFAALLLLTIVYKILEAAANDIISDGLASFLIIQRASFAGIAAAMLLAWSLDGKRKWVALGFALFIMFLFPTIETIGWQTSPVAITEQRAEQVNQAILRYHAQENKYPNALIDLSPWYLWHIPEPIMLRSSNAWCYEGGKDYYRLGYFFHEGFGARASVRIQSSAGTPPTLEWKCDRDVVNYNLMLDCGYTSNRTGCPPRGSQTQ